MTELGGIGRSLHRIAIAALVCAIGWNAAVAQNEESWPVTKGANDAEARAGDGEARARIRDLCASLYPPEGATAPRSRYPDWMKQLLCAYLTTDFSTNDERNKYVRKILAALRKNGAGEWRFDNGAPVVHIVTEDPYELSNKKWKGIKTLAVKRSRFHPEAAVIGVNESRFPKTVAQNYQEAERRIPEAESFIFRILAFALVADLLAGTEDAVSEETAKKRITAGWTDFKRTILTAAELPLPTGQAFDPRPPPVAVDPVESQEIQATSDLNSGRNVIVRTPSKGGKLIMINKIGAGDPLGFTRAITFFYNPKPKITPYTRLDTRLENIEPRYKIKKGYLLRSQIRTGLVIETFHGVPKKKAALRVVGGGGRDCTAAIRRHENEHVEHFWTAWREKVLLEIRRTLEAQNFKGLKEKDIRIILDKGKELIFESSISMTYLDIVADYVFEKKSLAGKARTNLKTMFGGKKFQKVYRNKLYEVANDLAEKYHAEVEVGLDDNCNPVKDPKSASRSFGKVGQGK